MIIRKNKGNVKAQDLKYSSKSDITRTSPSLKHLPHFQLLIFFYFYIQISYSTDDACLKTNLPIGIQQQNNIQMPCLFKTEIKDSAIQGKGFFALEDIPKGAVYWVWEDSNGPLPVIGYELKPNRIYTKQELYAVQDHQKLLEILHGGFYYADGDLFVELLDGTQFTNHSQDWNSQIIYDESKDYRKMTCVARKQIKAGDEITGYYGNYLSTQAKWVNDLMEKYLPDRKNIENAVITQGNKALSWEIKE